MHILPTYMFTRTCPIPATFFYTTFSWHVRIEDIEWNFFASDGKKLFFLFNMCLYILVWEGVAIPTGLVYVGAFMSVYVHVIGLFCFLFVLFFVCFVFWCFFFSKLFCLVLALSFVCLFVCLYHCLPRKKGNWLIFLQLSSKWILRTEEKDLRLFISFADEVFLGEGGGMGGGRRRMYGTGNTARVGKMVWGWRLKKRTLYH